MLEATIKGTQNVSFLLLCIVPVHYTIFGIIIELFRYHKVGHSADDFLHCTVIPP